MLLRRSVLPWFLLLLLLGAFGASLCRPDGVARSLGLGDAVEQRYRTYWRGQMRSFHRRVDRNTPAGAIIFLGASTVQGLNASQVRACSANFGIGGETSGELLDRLGDYGSLKRASAIVVMTGLNDVLRRDDADLGGRYRRLLAALPPATPVILSSLPQLPASHRPGRRFGPRIARANQLARTACEERPSCRFVDLHEPMSRFGALTEPDGIHLNSTGYALWSRLLRDALTAVGVNEHPCQGSASG